MIGKIGDYGFLSDINLIYTAFTKARFMVIVIGDPVGSTKAGGIYCTTGENKRVCTDTMFRFVGFTMYEDKRIPFA